VIKIYGKVVVKNHAIVTSTLDGNEWSDSCPSYLTPEKIARGIQWIGAAWVPEPVWKLMRKKILLPLPGT
jgi:hypothetical protein